MLDRDNLVVLRTFSKAAGIAGLRLGYGVFPRWLMHELWKFKQPYNVNAAASVAGIASLRHADRIEAVIEKLKAERSRLYALLEPFEGIETIPRLAGELHPVPDSRTGCPRPQARTRTSRDPRPALRQARLSKCIRVSVGRPEHTGALIDALRMEAG